MIEGDKVLVELTVGQVGEGWIMARVPKVGHHPPSNVRVPLSCVVVDEAPKPKARAPK